MATGSPLRDFLQELYDQHGRLTPELVVEHARPLDSPLHAAVFDKPVEEAAEAHYRDNARALIARYKIVYKSADGTAHRVRAWHAVSGPQGMSYEPAEKVAADPVLRAILLKDMERDWRALRDRYQHFEEFSIMVRDAMEVAD